MQIGRQSFLREVIFGPRARFGEFRDQQKTKNAISLGQTSPIPIVRNRSREAKTSTMDLAFIMFSHANSSRNVQLRVSVTMEASVAENLHTRLIFPVIEESHQESFLASTSSGPMQELTGQVAAIKTASTNVAIPCSPLTVSFSSCQNYRNTAVLLKGHKERLGHPQQLITPGRGAFRGLGGVTSTAGSGCGHGFYLGS